MSKRFEARNFAVEVCSLGKAYQIKHQKPDIQNYQTPRRSRPWHRNRQNSSFSEETFWALQDVSFRVEHGKVFGIVGKNGAGKSTLLKILSRITDPTEGYAEIHGRVGSLLEVGTGFHPELSGRENIYLNGTLLGMRRREINRVLDEIIEFAEVERFIDTPVKRYSSGMYVRLAFAVAANLNPEVLILDEVLAVGDVKFQKKCLGKMKDVTSQGRTVLFVSHSLSTVNSLCDECLFLEDGRVKLIGPTAQVTEAYFNSSSDQVGSHLDLSGAPIGDDIATLHYASLVDQRGNRISHASLNETFGIEIVYELKAFDQPIIPNLHIFTGGVCAFVTSPQTMPNLLPGIHRAIAWIPAHLLNAGTYTVNIAASSMSPIRIHFHVMDRYNFSLVENITDASRHGYLQNVPGIIRPTLDWEIDRRKA
jgi:lipopolysaccharide transport system ATP-binding protein